MHPLTYLVCVLSIAGILAQDDENLCIASAAQASCGACIAAAKDCAWCTSENFLEENLHRCDTFENHHKGPCKKELLQFPKEFITKPGNVKVGDGKTAEDAVQIQPQRVHMRLRPNNPTRIPLVFRMAANYPVDLYYLMDLSKSMLDDKDKLATLGNSIATRMSAITQNFRLGFGSFVDKVVSPFVSVVPEKLLQPCKMVNYLGEQLACVPPYGFRNHLSLDLQTKKFAKKVRESAISGNLDAPEGGFDAIMQVVACEQEIGWRDISRRMLVFSTDAAFHFAMDGKLGGIVKPNDGQCHMENNYYSESSNQDYPSVSQITHKIKEKSVNVIFAVNQLQFGIYEKLSRYIESSAVGILANDSGNIVDLIQDNYEKITSKVKLVAENVQNKNIKIEFFSRCNGSEEKKTDECGNLKIGQTVNFEAEISIKECPKDRREWRQELEIKPVGYQESLKIVLDIICECDCEKAENEDPSSMKCSDGNGTLVCGLCECNPGFYGEKCECKADSTASELSVEQCIGPKSTRVCSGRGQCECGKCKCDARAPNSKLRFDGKFCECDNYSCLRHDNKICGGSKRGTCRCGVCDCNEGFNGTACECEQSQEKCQGTNGLICNGAERGECRCNECVCNEQYSGPTCELCPSCPDECDKYSMCIHCRVFKNGKYSDEECDKRCPRTILEAEELEDTLETQVCQFTDEDGCKRDFSYEFGDRGKVFMKYEKQKVCPDSVNVLAIVGGVVGGIVAVGLLLLLIWKLMTFIYDTREFAKFEKERQNAKWDTGENPIYKQATSTFKNPTYGTR